MSETLAIYRWKPIEELSSTEVTLNSGGMSALYDTWITARERLEASSPGQLADFNRRLVRRLSVETGILERLYDLDQGTTEALVAKGFHEDLISHSSTNIEPSRLIDILRDQEAAVQLLVDCIAQTRGLTKSVLHELHAILTRHQDTTSAVDSLGNRREIPLLKGKFKEHPNNPRRPDGILHEYCPPVHVDSEIDRLLTLLPKYSDTDPIVVSAWLHHRFTQIHPYQDGNGRVARALTTLVLLRSRLLPLVVTRDIRTRYIEALESADRGYLADLTKIFSILESNAILQALSVDTDAEISPQTSVASAVIQNLADKFAKRRAKKLAGLRQVDRVAIELRAMAQEIVGLSLEEAKRVMTAVGDPALEVAFGGSDHKTGHLFRNDVIRAAKEHDKFVNFSENHYFLNCTLRIASERLKFVISFHHIGRELTGVMEASAFSKLTSYEADDGDRTTEHFSTCALEPFVFTYLTEPNSVRESFGKWLDGAIAIALKEYGDRL